MDQKDALIGELAEHGTLSDAQLAALLESGGPDDALFAAADRVRRSIYGDAVYIRSQVDVLDGQVAAVVVDDSATLKRVYHLPIGVQLIGNSFCEGMLLNAAHLYEAATRSSCF